MEIVNKNEKRDIIVLSYFELNNNINDRYLLYADVDDEKEKILYIGKFLNDNHKIVLPNKKELSNLRKVLSIFFDKEIDEKLLANFKYKYIDISVLNEFEIEEKSSHKILISRTEYIKLLSNKYLTYPEDKIINIEEIEKEGYDKNNKKIIPYSLIMIICYYLILLLSYQINPKPLNNLFSINGVTLTMWSLIVLLISMSAYNFEDREFKESFSIIFIIITLFLLSLLTIENKLNIFNDIIVCFIYSIIFTIPYSLNKRLSFYFINKYRCRNYITYYCIYLIPFFICIISLINIYNIFLSKYFSIAF